MKKMLMCATALSLVAGFAFSAHAECDGPYLAARGGIVKYNIDGQFNGDKTDTLEKKRLMLSAALGYRYEYFRTELEYVWRKHSEIRSEDDVQRYKTYSYMLNFYYDLMPYNWWTPFVGAGVGLSKLSYSAIDLISGDSEAIVGNYRPLKFTWSVGAGLSLKVTNRFNIDAGYRYYDMGKLKEAEVKSHEIYGGLRYVF